MFLTQAVWMEPPQAPEHSQPRQTDCNFSQYLGQHLLLSKAPFLKIFCRSLTPELKPDTDYLDVKSPRLQGELSYALEVIHYRMEQ